MELFAILSIIVLVILLFFYEKATSIKTPKQESIHLSDRDLLLMLNSESDRILSPKNLADKTELTLFQADSKLKNLHRLGLAKKMVSGVQFFYELKKPIVEADLVEMSDYPFISIEDLLALFNRHQGKMDIQDICVASGLPFQIIEREMKYFEQKGIIHKLSEMRLEGKTAKSFYTLQSTYKNIEAHDHLTLKEINLDLIEIYEKEFGAKN